METNPVNGGNEPPSADAIKLAKAQQIYSTWRNQYLNNISPTEFSRLEAVAPFLISEIAAAL